MALIAKYSLNGNANDSVWGNNWTATNITRTDGKQNQWASTAWTSSSLISIPDSTPLRATTIGIWMIIRFNWTQWAKHWIIIRKDTASWTRFLWWFFQPPWTQDISFTNYNWSTIYSVTKTLDTKPHYVVWIITWASWTLSMYVDWELAWSTNIWSRWWPTSNITIWKDPIVNDLNWAWLVDEVEIYDHAPSPAEIKQRYSYFFWYL